MNTYVNLVLIYLKIIYFIINMDNNSNDTLEALNCKHQFIDDYIDTMFPYREGILITYCQYCGLSKDYIEKIIKKIENKN